jgi:hypothetical protein
MLSNGNDSDSIAKTHLNFARFDIMDHAVLKSYRGIGNVILQIGGVNTTRTIEGDAMDNAILLNSHIDSALPSPGAAEYVFALIVVAATN